MKKKIRLSSLCTSECVDLALDAKNRERDPSWWHAVLQDLVCYLEKKVLCTFL